MKTRFPYAFYLIIPILVFTTISITGMGCSKGSENEIGKFVYAASLNEPRIQSAAVLLKNGHVLITGGTKPRFNIVASAELYDPIKDTFRKTGNMQVPRARHKATLLKDGNVLITGGMNALNLPIDKAEIYNPRTGTFLPVDNMSVPRVRYTTTLLEDGRVLILGGEYDRAQNIAEVYEPDKGVFRPLSNTLNVSRASHTATLLKNGKVLIVGGDKSTGKQVKTWRPSEQKNLIEEVAEIEIFDPKNETFKIIAKLNIPRSRHTATLLDSGEVLIVGGLSYHNTSPEECFKDISNLLCTTELFQPDFSKLSIVSKLNKSRSDHIAIKLKNGSVLILGGDMIRNLTEVYNPSSYSFMLGPNLKHPRYLLTATLLSSGDILVAGGNDRKPVLPSEKFVLNK